MLNRIMMALMVLSLFSCENPTEPLPLRSPDGKMPIVTGLRITTERDPTEIDIWGAPNDNGKPVSAQMPSPSPNGFIQPESVVPVGVVPITIGMKTPFPNPSNSSTALYFQIPVKMNVTIWIVPADLPTGLFSRVHPYQGISIRSLMRDKNLEAGSYGILWDGKDDDGKPVPTSLYRIYCQSGETILWRDVLFVNGPDEIVRLVKSSLD